ncbi:MAG TPA: hypothetical protein VMI73_05800 [Trebonia sp.]|nr:hypothetical protein [Trebonia sp.]
MISAPWAGSRPAVGSSRNISDGQESSSAAMAARLRSPGSRSATGVAARRVRFASRSMPPSRSSPARMPRSSAV